MAESSSGKTGAGRRLMRAGSTKGVVMSWCFLLSGRDQSVGKLVSDGQRVKHLKTALIERKRCFACCFRLLLFALLSGLTHPPATLVRECRFCVLCDAA